MRNLPGDSGDALEVQKKRSPSVNNTATERGASCNNDVRGNEYGGHRS
jgi:hypothetical protein